MRRVCVELTDKHRREGLGHDDIGEVLGVRADGDSRATDAEREDLRGIDPDGGAPTRFIEERKQEHEEGKRNADTVLFAAFWGVGRRNIDSGRNQKHETLTDAGNNKDLHATQAIR